MIRTSFFLLELRLFLLDESLKREIHKKKLENLFWNRTFGSNAKARVNSPGLVACRCLVYKL